MQEVFFYPEFFEVKIFLVFGFHGNFTETDQHRFIEAQRKDAETIVRFLQPKSDHNRNLSIKFEIFFDRADKLKADPLQSHGRAAARFKEMTVYRVWRPEEDERFPHEITHLVAHSLSKPYSFKVKLPDEDGVNRERELELVSTSFLQEGLAIATDDILFNRPWFYKDEHGSLRELTKKFYSEIKGIQVLEQVINFDGFNSHGDAAVLFAASFVKFLIERYGLEIFKRVYMQTKETIDSKKNVRIIEKIYRKSQSDLLKEWREYYL